MDNKICVYGYFRKGQMGHAAMHIKFGIDSFRYKKTVRIPGYIMYDDIFTPTIKFTGEPTDKITVDLIIANDEAYKYLQGSQSHEDFHENLINIDDNFYSIFTQWPVNNDNLKEVEYGDWALYSLK